MGLLLIDYCGRYSYQVPPLLLCTGTYLVPGSRVDDIESDFATAVGHRITVFSYNT